MFRDNDDDCRPPPPPKPTRGSEHARSIFVVAQRDETATPIDLVFARFRLSLDGGGLRLEAWHRDMTIASLYPFRRSAHDAMRMCGLSSPPCFILRGDEAYALVDEWSDPRSSTRQTMRTLEELIRADEK